ncbi:ATP-binding cassette domain-containing protein [Methanocella sp. MCL-LM]|uniref:ABC transporter ATP-binding protein n=1 Tax=Methanocella sp. MCL-LM TaxID=3412035 RepID=UPI003C711589
MVIETSSLGRRFGNSAAVEGVSISVGKGEVFGFLGPNGAGKTTTVRMLTCLISPSSGTATICGYDIRDRKSAALIRRRVGILTESPGFYETLTVRKNLRFFADLYHVDRRKANEAIERYLKLFGLYDKKDRVVGGFSKGMRQKLALIRCLMHEPEVLFLDEPTAGLDPESARVVRDAILSLKKEGRTIFLCTHNLDEAERLCDTVAIINRRILYAGSPGSLKDSVYGRKLVVRLEEVIPSVYKAVSHMSMVEAIEKNDDRIILQVSDPDRHCPDIINEIIRAGGRIRSVGELRHSMEDVYIKLIGDRCEL